LPSDNASPLKKLFFRLWPWITAVVCAGLLIVYWFQKPLSHSVQQIFAVLTDRQRVVAFVASFGGAAPLVFMVIQIAQVVLAPIPGEATGFIGGYLFGAFTGFFYSTIALALGSWINFAIGRFLGKRWVRQVIPKQNLEKFDYMLRHQGLLVIFVLFLFPGFPKDYLCLFLGVSTMPVRVFLLMATVGRIPGTLMLSLQGALVFERNYLIFCLVVSINLLGVYLGYRYREAIYHWVEKFNGPAATAIDEEDH
jgi:uncharacterized membrane protein YdjX (TVP38/TMEM64 family)